MTAKTADSLYSELKLSLIIDGLHMKETGMVMESSAVNRDVYTLIV
jgi:hypothetical protein